MKLAHIKWENVILAIAIPYVLYCLIIHNKADFLWDLFLFEILIHSLLTAMMYVGTYSLRQEFLHK